MTPDDFRARLATEPLILDGGLATELEAAGEDIGGSLWSARVLRERPDAVRRAHEAYLTSGAQVVITASYQVSRRGVIAAGGTADEADELLTRSVRVAQEAVDRAGLPGRTLVAASVGPWGATNHDGSEYRGRYGIPHHELVDFHRERLNVLVSAGPDLLAIETIPDLEEVDALVEVLADFPAIAAWLSVTTPDGTATSAGQPLTEVAEICAHSPSIVAVGVNCSAPHTVLPALTVLGAAGTSLQLVAYPNAGQAWDAESETWSGPASPLLPRDQVAAWRYVGAGAIGGCCGVGPAGIADLANAVAGS